MTKVIATLMFALGIIALSTTAWAKCPAGSKYQCKKGWFSDKVVCGCR
jgi:hypothetical protein